MLVARQRFWSRASGPRAAWKCRNFIQRSMPVALVPIKFQARSHNQVEEVFCSLLENIKLLKASTLPLGQRWIKYDDLTLIAFRDETEVKIPDYVRAGSEPNTCWSKGRPKTKKRFSNFRWQKLVGSTKLKMTSNFASNIWLGIRLEIGKGQIIWWLGLKLDPPAASPSIQVACFPWFVRLDWLATVDHDNCF